MKNVMKTATLESKFPLLAVENGCIISKDADITVAYRVELPELFTLTRAEYESMHSTWAKAVKVLPNYSIVHKQDFFIEEGYRPDICKEDLSFLSRSFERHFNERPYLQHTCYLFLTNACSIINSLFSFYRSSNYRSNFYGSFYLRLSQFLLFSFLVCLFISAFAVIGNICSSL